MKRLFLSLILILLAFFFLFTHKVYSTNFHLTYDYLSNRLFTTPIVSIFEDIEVNSDYIIEYDESLIDGLRDPVFNENIFWEDHVSVIGGRYRRNVGVNDRVLIGPNTRLKIFALVRNESSRSIRVRNWRLYLSKMVHKNDSWCNFGYNYGPYSHVLLSFIFNGENINKSGCSWEPFVGQRMDIPSGEYMMMEFMDFDVLQSFEILNFSHNFYIHNKELKLQVTTQVRNNFYIPFESVEYVHGDFSLVRDFESREVFTYSYELDYGDAYDFGDNFFESFSLKIPGQTECSVYGSSLFNENYNPDSRGMTLRRGHELISASIFRHITDVDWYPEGEAMCIEVLPYSLSTEDLNHFIEPIPKDFLDVSFQEGSQKDFKLGEDFVIDVKIQNVGDFVFNDLEFFLDYDSLFQRYSFSNCNFLNGVIYISSIGAGETINCYLSFDILELNEPLKFQNHLFFKGDLIDSAVFKLIPDLEISVVYENNDFVFNATYENLRFLFTDYFDFRGVRDCKGFYFMDLATEICPL